MTKIAFLNTVIRQANCNAIYSTSSFKLFTIICNYFIYLSACFLCLLAGAMLVLLNT